jgi:hypothetical protein
MMYFLDVVSGQSQHESPFEAFARLAVRDVDLWAPARAVTDAEVQRCFPR